MPHFLIQTAPYFGAADDLPSYSNTMSLYGSVEIPLPDISLFSHPDTNLSLSIVYC